MNFFKIQIRQILKKDPSVKTKLEAIIHPSFKAMFYYRISHYLFINKFIFLAKIVSYRAKKITGIEIHPGAVLENDLFIDHGSGVVIGETAIVGKDVTIFHGVTLGGRGNKTGKRHPTVKDHVLIGSGAKILGNITIGNNVKIGANAVVVKDIADNKTVIGIPGREI